MKSNKGITLMSLVIYVTAITVVLSIIATITIYFNKNTRNIEQTIEKANTLTRINEYMSNDINKSISSVVNTEGTELILTQNTNDTIKYTIAGDGIYREKVKLCSNPQNGSEFEQEEIYNKTKINIKLKIENENDVIDKTLEYIISK